MPKFYAQCGPHRLVVTTEDASTAAMRLVDIALSNHGWIYDDETLSDRDRRAHLMLEALLHLDPTVQVSQRGFDREDASRMGTPETVSHWHESMTAVGRLLQAAGLSPRPISQLAPVPVQAETRQQNDRPSSTASGSFGTEATNHPSKPR
ncbi:MAG: hypothetical protein AAGD07_00775 [Planctomycetota bacterium]